ncbi:hypothetical protein Syun_025827 [Stephania yunnanensis]|uniref:Uncharacterized protein n=1 Tax=Stephania yunnanensis TaxID=152371 RepID=A0AAP0EVA8_9MAGN
MSGAFAVGRNAPPRPPWTPVAFVVEDSPLPPRDGGLVPLLLGGLVWFAVPLSLATSLGLVALALDLPIIANEASHGIVPHAAATALMGKGGSILLLTMLFMIIVENATASGRYSIGLGEDTDARTFEAEETSGDVLEDLTYDYNAEAFVQRNEHQPKNLNLPPTVGIFNAPPTFEPINLEVHSVTRKRNRAEKEGNLDSSRNNNFQMDSLNKLTETISSFADKVDRFLARDQGCWKLIKEIPDFPDSDIIYMMSHLNMQRYDESKEVEMEENEVEELTEILECLLVSMQAILQALHEVIFSMYCEPVPLTRRSVTRNGSEYIETILNEDAEHF